MNVNRLLAAASATVAGVVGVHGVDDDHADTEHAATLLPVGQWKTGVLDGRGDVDTFRIDMVGQSDVLVRSSGRADTVGILADASGVRIAADDDSGPGYNFRIPASLGPGVYFLAVEDFFGSTQQHYAVAVQLTSAVDHADTHQAATLLRLLTTRDLEGVSPEALLSTAGRLTRNDVDVFRIDVPSDGTPVAIRSAGNTDTVAQLFSADDSGLTLLDEDDNSGRLFNFQIDTLLDRGVYYVRVSGDDTGTYRILAVAHDRRGDAH